MGNNRRTDDFVQIPATWCSICCVLVQGTEMASQVTLRLDREGALFAENYTHVSMETLLNGNGASQTTPR